MVPSTSSLAKVAEAWEVGLEYVRDNKDAYGLTTMFGHDKDKVILILLSLSLGLRPTNASYLIFFPGFGLLSLFLWPRVLLGLKPLLFLLCLEN